MPNEDTRWFALDVTADPDVSDAVEGVLSEFDVLGIEIDQLRKKPDEDIVVTGYFNKQMDDDVFRSRLLSVLDAIEKPASFLRSVEWREVAGQDWLSEWKKHWQATAIGKFLIAPPWESVNQTDRIVIKIEPNMAFGTGTHETTKLCLAAISELYKPPATVLDVGTGTGILAIATAKLGAVEVSACDTDPDSIAIASENAVSNETPGIEFAVSTLEENGPAYDFVLANLTLDVIEPMLDTLLMRSKDVLILSGILIEQEASIVGALKDRGVYNAKIDRMGEWLSVVLRRRG